MVSLPRARLRDERRGRRWSPRRGGRAACRAPGAPAASSPRDPSPRTHLQPRGRSPRPGHLFLSGGSGADPGLARPNWRAARHATNCSPCLVLLLGGDGGRDAVFWGIEVGGGGVRGGSSGGGPRARAPDPRRAVVRTLTGGAKEAEHGGAAVAVGAVRRLVAEGGGRFRIWEFPPPTVRRQVSGSVRLGMGSGV